MFRNSGKKVLIVSIVINILFITALTVFIFKKGGIDYISIKFNQYVLKTSTSTANTSDVNDKVVLFKQLKPTGHDIYFVGDSITEQGLWEDYFPNLSCRNRGIGGNTTIDVLSRLDEVITAKPSKIFLLVGINDLINNKKIGEISNNYSKILDELKTNLPDTKIFVESVLPINKQKAKEVFEKNHNTVVTIDNADIDALNIKIKELSEERNIKFIDLTGVFKDNAGNMKYKLTYDGIHLEPTSYLSWSKIINNYVYN